MRYGVPDVQRRTTGASDRQQIVITTLLAFAITFAAKFDTTKPVKANAAGAALGTNFVGWIVLVIMLSVASDFENTQPLAKTFGWLILIAALLVSGPKALQNIQSGIGRGTPAKGTK